MSSVYCSLLLFDRYRSITVAAGDNTTQDLLHGIEFQSYYKPASQQQTVNYIHVETLAGYIVGTNNVIIIQSSNSKVILIDIADTCFQYKTDTFITVLHCTETIKHNLQHTMQGKLNSPHT